jgi:hypothetical protein
LENALAIFATASDGVRLLKPTTTKLNRRTLPMNWNLNTLRDDPAAFKNWCSQAYGEPKPELPDLRERLLHVEGYYLGLICLQRCGAGYTAFDECSEEWLAFADLDAVERDLEMRANQ